MSAWFYRINFAAAGATLAVIAAAYPNDGRPVGAAMWFGAAGLALMARRGFQ